MSQIRPILHFGMVQFLQNWLEMVNFVLISFQNSEIYPNLIQHWSISYDNYPKMIDFIQTFISKWFNSTKIHLKMVNSILISFKNHQICPNFTPNWSIPSKNQLPMTNYI